MKNRSLLRIATVICFMVSVLFLGQISAFADVIDDTIKPIHEYNFDSDIRSIVADTGKVQIDGTSYGANKETFIKGYNGIGKARYFNGIDDYLNFGGNMVLPQGAKSIRFKIKKEASTLSNKLEAIISTSGGNLNSGLFIGIGSDELKLADDSFPLSPKTGTLYIMLPKSSKTLNFEIQTPESVCDGQWHDILFTWDGTTNTNSVKLYLDDMFTPIAQTTAVFSTESGLAFRIGRIPGYFGSSDEFLMYNGYLDDLRIYDTVITSESTTPVSSLNLKAIGGDSKVDLTWNAVTNATSYTIKRATSTGGTYTTIATDITGTSYTDTNVANGTTYYYIVTTTINDNESLNSNEASATPMASDDPEQPSGNRALLEITMVTGERKEYELAMDKVNDFIAWYNSKAASSPTYMIEKNYNKASFTSRKDYIAYDQISNFEVNGYNN